MKPLRTRLRQVRTILWLGAALAFVGIFMERGASERAQRENLSGRTSFGVPFTLVGANGRGFSSSALEGKPYAIYFGFTRCSDVCPMTLQRLVRLRRAAAGDNAFNIVFVTIDPLHDGPKQVGQYAELFGAPIIGLTGSPEQIAKVKKNYGIFAQPSDHAMPGKEMQHTAVVELFNRKGESAGTISADDPDQAALAKLKQLLS
jgi:protein SCO1/2